MPDMHGGCPVARPACFEVGGNEGGCVAAAVALRDATLPGLLLQVVHRPGKRAIRPGLAKFTVLTKTGGVPVEQPAAEHAPVPAPPAGKAGSRPGTGSAPAGGRPISPAKSAAATAKEAKEAAAREAAAKEAAAAAAAAAAASPVLTPVEYTTKSRWLIPAHGSVELLVKVRL